MFGKYPETELVWGERSELLTEKGGRAFPHWVPGHSLCGPCPGLPALIPCPPPSSAPGESRQSVTQGRGPEVTSGLG